jgi:hypothetical protein
MPSRGGVGSRTACRAIAAASCAPQSRPAQKRAWLARALAKVTERHKVGIVRQLGHRRSAARLECMQPRAAPRTGPSFAGDGEHQHNVEPAILERQASRIAGARLEIVLNAPRDAGSATTSMLPLTSRNASRPAGSWRNRRGEAAGPQPISRRDGRRISQTGHKRRRSGLRNQCAYIGYTLGPVPICLQVRTIARPCRGNGANTQSRNACPSAVRFPNWVLAPILSAAVAILSSIPIRGSLRLGRTMEACLHYC